MAALTWRNVDAPDLSGAIRTLSDSNASLQNAFSGAGLALKDWGRGVRDANTGNIELALAKFGTNADLQAAVQQGLLDPNALRETYGNFDASAIARYQNDLANSLQTREVNQQGIDKNNNLNKFGGDLSQTLIDARNGVPGAAERLQSLQANGLLGSVAAQFAPQIADAAGAAGRDAETSRSNRANEGIAGMNAATNRLNVTSEISDRNRRWDAGNLGRQVSDLGNQATLDADANLRAGAAQFDRDSQRLPAEQREAYSRSMTNMNPADREARLKGFDASVANFTGAGPTAQKAAAAVAPDIQQVSNLSSGLKGIVSASAGQANAWNNMLGATENSEIKSPTDAIAALKTAGLDTTDRKVNDLVQQAIGMGATPAEAVAIAQGSGRGSYTSIVDGKITLDGGRFLDGVKDYMKYKTSTDGIKQRQSVTDQNQKIDTLSASITNLLQRQQYYLQQGRPDRAQNLQSDIDKAKSSLNAYAGLVNQTNPVQQQAPANINWNGGAYPGLPWQR